MVFSRRLNFHALLVEQKMIIHQLTKILILLFLDIHFYNLTLKNKKIIRIVVNLMYMPNSVKCCPIFEIFFFPESLWNLSKIDVMGAQLCTPQP